MRFYPRNLMTIAKLSHIIVRTGQKNVGLFPIKIFSEIFQYQSSYVKVSLNDRLKVVNLFYPLRNGLRRF